MTLTRRETHFLIILGALMLGVFLTINILDINMLVFNAWASAHEPQLLLITIVPLGLYLIFEKERHRYE
jgi:hypothetical protein